MSLLSSAVSSMEICTWKQNMSYGWFFSFVLKVLLNVKLDIFFLKVPLIGHKTVGVFLDLTGALNQAVEKLREGTTFATRTEMTATAILCRVGSSWLLSHLITNMAAKYLSREQSMDQGLITTKMQSSYTESQLQENTYKSQHSGKVFILLIKFFFFFFYTY